MNEKISKSEPNDEKALKSVTFLVNQVAILCKMVKTPLAYYKRK
jgi:hypothetical protein